MIRPLHSLAAFALAVTLAILGPLAFGAPAASADTATDTATTIRIDPSLLDENGTGVGAGLTTVGADPNQPIAMIVWLSGPPLWDLYKAARDQAGAKDSDLVVPVSTLETWNAAIAARQVPAERAIEALGANVISHYRAVANGLLVHATRDQVPALMAVPGVVAITAAPSVTLDLEHSVPHIGAKRVQDELKFDGTGVVAAIIDTGVDYMHADFDGIGTSEAFLANDPNFVEDINGKPSFPTAKVVGGVDLAGSTYAAGCPQLPDYTCTLEPEPDDDPLDEMYVDGMGGQGHGTHVGGITAGEGTVDPTTGDTVVPSGVAPGARLVAVKIFGNPRGPIPAGAAGGGGTDLVADGLEWVMLHNLGMDIQGWPAEDASGNRMQINVINMSVGGPWGTGMAEYNDIIGRLVDSGVTTVMSAGNNGNTPYITGAPAAAEMAISVASSFANGQTGVLFTANWADQTLEALSEQASDVLAPQFQSLPPYENLPMAWYGLACNNPDGSPSTPAQDVSEKVALIERGTCIFTEKLLNAQKMGAVAVVVFSDARPPGVMGGDCWPKLTCVDRPAIMIDNSDGLQIKTLLEAGTEVKASFPLTPREELTNTISDFSSRGPARFTAGVKPQITAPGSAINSARAGTGYGAVHQGGTSMSGPTVAGVAALLWQRNMKEDLKLTGAEVGALMLNYSRTDIHTELDNAGPVVGISRQGAGLVNAFTSATAKTVVRSDQGIAELGYGDVYASNEPTTYVKTLTVKNFSAAAKTYKASASFIFPENDGAGITFSFEPASLTVAAGGTGSIAVTMHVDPAKLADWTLPGPGRVDAMTSTPNFQDAQIEGTVYLTEVNASGQPVVGGDLIGVPYTSMPHRSSCTVATTTDPINLKNASTEQKVVNNCAQPGAVATYMRLGTDPAEPGYPAKLNIENVGVRWFDSPTRDPNFPDVPLQVLEFAIHTSGTRRIPLDTAFRVYFDTNRDGQFEKVGWNLQNGLRWVTLLGKPFPGTLIPDFNSAFDATGNAYINLEPYNIEETTTVLRFFANHPSFGVGFDMTKGDAMFDFAVSVGDQTEDYAVTDTFLGYDLAPDNLEAGVEPGIHVDAAYRFDQKLVDCATLTDAAGNKVPGVPELVSVAPNGGQVTFNVKGCTAHASQANAAGMALMMHYPWNMPGENVQFRSIGQPMIYLPLAQKEFELYPPPPTVEVPTPETPPTAVH